MGTACSCDSREADNDQETLPDKGDLAHVESPEKFKADILRLHNKFRKEHQAAELVSTQCFHRCS